MAAAWKDGDIGAAHVDAVLRVKRPVTEEALARDESILVDAAKTMKFAQFCTVVDYWEQHADQDGSDEAAEARKAQRDVYLVPTPGRYLGKMNLDPIGGAIVAKELKAIEDEFFEADWAEAKERLGRDPHADELCRTPAQRRADAMIEMAVRSASASAGARRPEPLFTRGHRLPDGGRAHLRARAGTRGHPGLALALVDQATFERIIFAPGKRAECSVTSRFFTGATRRVIEVRDRQCQHEFCDLPADRCQIDHIVPYSQGGLTEQENGQVLCGPHNRMRYERPPPGGVGDIPRISSRPPASRFHPLQSDCKPLPGVVPSFRYGRSSARSPSAVHPRTIASRHITAPRRGHCAPARCRPS